MKPPGTSQYFSTNVSGLHLPVGKALPIATGLTCDHTALTGLQMHHAPGRSPTLDNAGCDWSTGMRLVAKAWKPSTINKSPSLKTVEEEGFKTSKFFCPCPSVAAILSPCCAAVKLQDKGTRGNAFQNTVFVSIY